MSGWGARGFDDATLARFAAALADTLLQNLDAEQREVLHPLAQRASFRAARTPLLRAPIRERAPTRQRASDPRARPKP